MMVDYIVYHLFNDLDKYSLLDHTHSNYALSSHTHTEYVTSNQVTSLVNTAIESGDISMNSILDYKSVQYVSVSNKNGVTYTGKGIFILSGNTTSSMGSIQVDGLSSSIQIEDDVNTSNPHYFIFNKSIYIYANSNNHTTGYLYLY